MNPAAFMLVSRGPAAWEVQTLGGAQIEGMVNVCPIGFLADGVIIETPTSRTGWGHHPKMEWIRFQTRDFLLKLTREFPDLEFLISLSWVDLEQTWQPQTGCSVGGGPGCRST